MREAFLAAITADAEASMRDEPGCVRFDVIADAADPDRFMLYELYRDQGALEAHRRTVHFRRWREAAAEVLEADQGQLNRLGTTVWSGDQPSPAAGAAPEAPPPASMVIRAAAITAIDRGGGVVTLPYVGRWNMGAGRLTTGETRFAPGTALPLHHHNVEEQVVVLEGTAEVELGGRRHRLGQGDATWAAAGVPHRFANRSAHPLRITWVYGGRAVTRTIVASGETVEHLSERDRLGSAGD